MPISDELTLAHMAHGLKIVLLGTAIVTLTLFGFGTLEVALQSRQIHRPPDTACLNFAFRLSAAVASIFANGQTHRAAEQGAAVAVRPGYYFLLVDLGVVAATCLLSTTRATFFTFASLAFVPGAFCAALVSMPTSIAIHIRIVGSLGAGILMMVYHNSFTWFIVINFYVLEVANSKPVEGPFMQGAMVLAIFLLQPALAFVYRAIGILFRGKSDTKTPSTLQLVIVSTASLVDGADDGTTPLPTVMTEAASFKKSTNDFQRELQDAFLFYAGFEVISVMTLLRINQSVFYAGLVLYLCKRPIFRVIKRLALVPLWERLRGRSAAPKRVSPSDVGEFSTHPASACSLPQELSDATRADKPADADAACGGGGSQQLLTDILYGDRDPLKDFHEKVALYTARVASLPAAVFYLALDSPLLAGVGSPSEACQRRLAGSTVASAALRLTMIVAANVVTDVVALVVRVRIGDARRRKLSEARVMGRHPQELLVFVSLWAVVDSSFTIVELVLSVVMFLRGAFLLEACEP
ncbi:hypothetical protein DFJ73DRAFT_800907 [Zopfochytrium polystomum]|nr:hypothetical protein DFJ73DRAFT_800907 [Zopfochytrium polystomum]